MELPVNFDIQKELEKAVEGWKPTQQMLDAESNKVDDKRKYLKYLQSKHKKLIKLLENIFATISDDNCKTKVNQDIKKYIRQSEDMYFRSKRIVNFLEEDETDNITKSEIFDEWNNNKEYKLEVTENGEYLLTLPPLISQHMLDVRKSEGAAIKFLVQRLIKEFTEQGNELELFYDATIEFYHFIDRNKPEYAVPDPDNVDVKRVIDALHGLIIESDNLLHLNLVHYGFESHKTYTKILIKKGKRAYSILKG